jgi:hypothetical protein
MRSAGPVAGALLGIAALASPLMGCGSSGAPGAKNKAMGTIRMTLTAQTNGTTYRLRNAIFDISGVVSLSLDSETNPNASVLSATLPAGNYSIYLQDGWFLERLDGTTFVVVDATLVSPNPTSFAIVTATTTNVLYQFATNGTIVSIGSGTLDVSIDVTAPSCTNCTGAICGGACVDLSATLLDNVTTALPTAACVPTTTISGLITFTLCGNQTCGGETGCPATATWGSLTLSTATDQLSGSVDISSTIDLEDSLGGSCTANVLVSGTFVASVAFVCAEGSESLAVTSVTPTITAVSVNGCGAVQLLSDFFISYAESLVEQYVNSAVTAATATCP